MSRKGVVEIEITCQLDPGDLRPWDELTPKQQEEQKGTNPGCEGHGDFSGFCIHCHFCLDWETMDSYEEENGKEEKANAAGDL